MELMTTFIALKTFNGSSFTFKLLHYYSKIVSSNLAPAIPYMGSVILSSNGALS
jgi:hypothetical protein